MLFGLFKKYGFVLALFPLIALSSCDKTEEVNFNYKYDYYPKEEGHFVIYNVDSIIFDDFNQTSDTFDYQIKQVVDSTFEDNLGRTAYRLTRFYRANSNLPWTFSQVWYFVPTQTTLEVVEDNQRFVKLLFPPYPGITWHGNQYITITNGNEYLEGWEYEMLTVDEPETVGNLQFDSTITVLQDDNENLIEKVYAKEIFAKHVGLVYKQLLNLEKQNVTAPWTQPESGFILTMIIDSYGTE